MVVAEKVVADMVARVSERMKDPNYTQLAVGDFVQAQPNVSRYVSAQAAAVGGGEGVVQVVFHLEVLRRCFEAAHGSTPAVLTFENLDDAFERASLTELERRQPAFADYLASNIDSPEVRDVVAHVAIAFDARYL